MGQHVARVKFGVEESTIDAGVDRRSTKFGEKYLEDVSLVQSYESFVICG